ncbi:tail assembly structural protein [Shewanella phage S0112]|nr:tail assembly structural protein [Shewanella phage S0112]
MPYIIYAIVVIVLAFALRPKPPSPTPPSLNDLDVPTAEQGKPIPVVFGTYVVQSPNIVWYGDLGYNAIKSGGGK